MKQNIRNERKQTIFPWKKGKQKFSFNSNIFEIYNSFILTIKVKIQHLKKK